MVFQKAAPLIKSRFTRVWPDDTEYKCSRVAIVRLVPLKLCFYPPSESDAFCAFPD